MRGLPLRLYPSGLTGVDLFGSPVPWHEFFEAGHLVVCNALENPATLRANKSETIEWLKFTLEGVGERTHGYAFEDTAF
jgi:hypothetical protein